MEAVTQRVHMSLPAPNGFRSTVRIDGLRFSVPPVPSEFLPPQNSTSRPVTGIALSHYPI
jgi:hypothetical protein